VTAAAVAAVLDRSDERDTWLERLHRAYRDGYQAGYTAGWDNHANQEGFDPHAHLIEGESYEVMETRRYGDLPEGFEPPQHEEHPGEARRRARALAPRPGDFEGAGA
jgi:hypothetical protein